MSLMGISLTVILFIIFVVLVAAFPFIARSQGPPHPYTSGASLPVQVPPNQVGSDRQALVELYLSTQGESWQRSDNWLSAEPLSSWYGVQTENGRVTHLQLPLNRLDGELPHELGDLTSLKFLDLDSNDLYGNIPAALANLTDLTHLYLWENDLSGPIPPALGNLSNLRSLQLWGNYLSGSIPSQLGNLTKLQALVLHDNELTGSIPPELGKLTDLRGLTLSMNDLSGGIPPELTNLTSLEYMRIFNRGLSGCIPRNCRMCRTTILPRLPVFCRSVKTLRRHGSTRTGTPWSSYIFQPGARAGTEATIG